LLLLVVVAACIAQHHCTRKLPIGRLLLLRWVCNECRQLPQLRGRVVWQLLQAAAKEGVVRSGFKPQALQVA